MGTSNHKIHPLVFGFPKLCTPTPLKMCLGEVLMCYKLMVSKKSQKWETLLTTFTSAIAIFENTD